MVALAPSTAPPTSADVVFKNVRREDPSFGLVVVLRHDGLRLMSWGEGLEQMLSNITLRLTAVRKVRWGSDERKRHLAKIPRLHIEFPQLLGQRFEPIHDNMNHR